MHIEVSKSNNVVYTIDEENKVVTATIKCKAQEPEISFISQYLKHTRGEGKGPLVERDDIWVGKYLINNEFTGKAKCHPDDSFNIEFGKQLALLRAKEKYQRAIYKRMGYIAHWIEQLNERTKKMDIRCYRRLIETCCSLYTLEKKVGAD